MLKDHIDLAREQIEAFERQADFYSDRDDPRSESQLAYAKASSQRFEALLAYLEGLPGAQPEIGLGDMDDLPQELKDQLIGSQARAQQDHIVEVIRKRGGRATLDEILVDLYRQFDEINKRANVTNKLNRLSKSGFVWPVSGMKGTYTTEKPR